MAAAHTVVVAVAAARTVAAMAAVVVAPTVVAACGCSLGLFGVEAARPMPAERKVGYTLAEQKVACTLVG